jgi:F0F1-type ATP synthase assembly protein I
VKKADDNPWLIVGRYLALMTTVPASIFVGYELGAWLDERFGTHFLSIVFVILGTVAGFTPIFRDLTKDSLGKK